jgi:hypothetical protein
VPISITYTPGGVHNPRVDPKTLEPTIGARFRRLIRIRLDVNYIPFGFTGESWGRPDIPENVYSTDGNWVMSGGLVLDIGTFLPVNR